MRITHIGHSCLLVESEGVRVLLDPGVFTHGFEELTGLDAVLVTHAHPDHVDVERLPQLLEANDGARLLAEPEIAAQLSGVGIEATPVHPDDDLSVGGLEVRGVGGLHAVIHADIPRIGNVGYVLTGDGTTLFHPGDSIEVVPEGVDVLGLPLNAPWQAAKEAVEFLRAVAPRLWFPMHDALLSPAGRSVYLRVIGGLAPEGSEQRDLASAGPTPLA